MIAYRIIDSAKFLKMPISTQALYFHLIVRADDDGVVEAFNIMRMTGSTEDDLRVLVSKQYVTILNEDLVAYINDWNQHNLIRPDRKIDSMYKELLLKIIPDVEIVKKRQRADTKKLSSNDDTQQKMDSEWTDHGQQEDSIGKVRLGYVSLDEDSIGEVIKAEKEYTPITPHEEIKELYNTICKSLPSVRSLTEERREKIRTRWKQLKFNIDNFKEVFEIVENSSFCKGCNDRKWKADFDWIMKNETNIIKILEGKYGGIERNNVEEERNNSAPQKSNYEGRGY